MNTRHSPITQSDTPGDPTCHLNLPLQAYSFPLFSTPLSLRKQLAPFDVWLASHWVTFTAASDRDFIYSCCSQDGGIIFYMAPCYKYRSWTSCTASWHLKIDSPHLETKITEMLWLFGPWNTFLYICQKDPQTFGDKRIHQNPLCITRWNLYLFSICWRIILVYYNLSFISVIIIYITFDNMQHCNDVRRGKKQAVTW